MFANDKSLFFLQFSIKNRSSHELAKKVIRLKLEAHFNLHLQSISTPQKQGELSNMKSLKVNTQSSHKLKKSSRDQRDRDIETSDNKYAGGFSSEKNPD